MLARLFQQHASSAVWAACAASPSLEDSLYRLFHSGQDSWPQIQLTPEQLVIFLAQQLPPEAVEPSEMAALRARDLYLVCAFGLRHRAAQEIIETQYIPRVREALRRLGISEPLIADIAQDLCWRLIEKQDATVVRRGYSGRGDLVGWLCTCAVREARRRQKRDQRSLELEQSLEESLPDQRKNPEAALLQRIFKDAFQTAFREAIVALTSRERNLLRYHFLARLSIDQIGNIYHIHRATAARWVTQAQERLRTLTREYFLRRAPMSDDSLPQIMELIQSQLSVNLRNVLQNLTEHDRPSRVPKR